MHRAHPAAFVMGMAILAMLALSPAVGLSSAESGPAVRNAFGPDVGLAANRCRGACGGGCPKSCEIEVAYECVGASQLRRVEAYTCGTHTGCREHDQCLDTCLQDNPQSSECQPQCDSMAMQKYGLESSASWLLGSGPYDGTMVFEYTRQSPAALEPLYRCPPGANRQCDRDVACVTADGTSMDPVFDVYPAASAQGMQISGFRTGPQCAGGEEKICGQASTIRMTSADTCANGSCTRFAMEFDYRNADPSAPLECTTSTRGGDGDFIGDLIKLGGDALSTRTGGATAGEAGAEAGGEGDGMAQLLGMFGKVIASADSPEDLQVSITPLDEHGNPIESQRVGTDVGSGPPPIPRTIDLPAASGHLYVPMYQLASGMKSGEVKERRIMCTHKGSPVLETVVRLQ